MDFMLAAVMAWSLARRVGAAARGSTNNQSRRQGSDNQMFLGTVIPMGLNLVVFGAVAVSNRSIFIIPMVIGFNSGRASVSKVVTPVLDASNNGF